MLVVPALGRAGAGAHQVHRPRLRRGLAHGRLQRRVPAAGHDQLLPRRRRRVHHPGQHPQPLPRGGRRGRRRSRAIGRAARDAGRCSGPAFCGRDCSRRSTRRVFFNKLNPATSRAVHAPDPPAAARAALLLRRRRAGLARCWCARSSFTRRSRRWSTTSGIILGGVLLSRRFGIDSLAWGVLAGALLRLRCGLNAFGRVPRRPALLPDLQPAASGLRGVAAAFAAADDRRLAGHGRQVDPELLRRGRPGRHHAAEQRQGAVQRAADDRRRGGGRGFAALLLVAVRAGQDVRVQRRGEPLRLAAAGGRLPADGVDDRAGAADRRPVSRRQVQRAGRACRPRITSPLRAFAGAVVRAGHLRAGVLRGAQHDGPCDLRHGCDAAFDPDLRAAVSPYGRRSGLPSRRTSASWRTPLRSQFCCTGSGWSVWRAWNMASWRALRWRLSCPLRPFTSGAG